MNSSTPTIIWMGPGVIPAPPGKTANFINPENQTNGTIALHTICLFIVTIVSRLASTRESLSTMRLV